MSPVNDRIVELAAVRIDTDGALPQLDGRTFSIKAPF